jgi:thiol-disulfide isomerase/thioredoxin
VHTLLLMFLLGARGALLPAGTPAPFLAGQDFEGTVTIVDFFATWCPHCREALPDYDRLKDAFGERVRLVIIDVEEDPAAVRAFFARRRLPAGAELMFDRTGATARAWRVTGFPTVYLLDKRGVVRAAWSGWGGDSLRYLSEMIPYLENEDRRQASDGPRGKRGQRGARGRPDAVRSKPVLSDEDERARALGVEVLH